MPKGYGKDIGKVNAKVRSAVVSALRILDEQGTPLKVLLAREFQRDPVRTLSAVSRFLPTEARVEVLDVAALHLAAVQQMNALPMRHPIIDVPQLPMRDTEAARIDAMLS